MLMSSHLIGFGARSEVTPGTYQYRTTIPDGSDATTYKNGVWDGVSIGDADPDRHVILAIGLSASTRTVSTVTIGGVSASRVSDGVTEAQQQGSTTTVEMWIAAVPTGTTANIEIVCSGASNRCVASVWTAELETATAVDVDKNSNASGANVTLNANDNCFCLAFHSVVAGSLGVYSWTNVSERVDSTLEASAMYSAADAATDGPTINPTATWTNGVDTRRALVCATFQLRSSN